MAISRNAGKRRSEVVTTNCQREEARLEITMARHSLPD